MVVEIYTPEVKKISTKKMMYVSEFKIPSAGANYGDPCRLFEVCCLDASFSKSGENGCNTDGSRSLNIVVEDEVGLAIFC